MLCKVFFFYGYFPWVLEILHFFNKYEFYLQIMGIVPFVAFLLFLAPAGGSNSSGPIA